MSSKLCNNWKEAIFEESSHANLNNHSDAVMSITHSDKSGAKVLEEIRNNKQVSLLGQKQVSEELFLAHHVEEASEGIRSSLKEIACFQGLVTKATTLQLNSGMLSDGIDMKCPSVESIWSAVSVQEFSSLAPAKITRERIFNFRPLIALPPFVTKKIAESGVRSSVYSAIGLKIFF